jgi:hypothetical protein
MGGDSLRRLHSSHMGQHCLQVVLHEFPRGDSISFNRKHHIRVSAFHNHVVAVTHFSITGAIKLAKNGNNAIRWFGLSAVTLGTHFVIYLIYNAVGAC